MPTLIINADDFGLTKGVNYGIVESYLNGIVSSTTMLVNTPGTNHAVSLAKEHPQLGVGIHLALTIGKPVLKTVSSLIDDEGNFKRLAQQRNEQTIDLDEVLKEWTAQIETFYGYGLRPTHLDSHHHIHTWSHLVPVIEQLSKTYHLPWRNNFDVPPLNIKVVSTVFDSRFYKEGVRSDSIDAILFEHNDKDTVEVMCHPGYIDQDLLHLSSYTTERALEAQILTSFTLPEYCRTSKVR